MSDFSKYIQEGKSLNDLFDYSTFEHRLVAAMAKYSQIAKAFELMQEFSELPFLSMTITFKTATTGLVEVHAEKEPLLVSVPFYSLEGMLEAIYAAQSEFKHAD